MSSSEKPYRILVFSDSHDVDIFMRGVYRKRRGDCDAVIHLGDGLREFLRMTDGETTPTAFCTSGNMDNPAKYNYPPRLIELGGYRIFICHGAAEGVKYDLDSLTLTALKNDADIALFGHTHTAHDAFIPAEKLGRARPLYIINPGSITSPRDGGPSYANIELSDAGVYVVIGRV